MLLNVKPEEDLYMNYKCGNSKGFHKKMLLSELDWNVVKKMMIRKGRVTMKKADKVL